MKSSPIRLKDGITKGMVMKFAIDTVVSEEELERRLAKDTKLTAIQKDEMRRFCKLLRSAYKVKDSEPQPKRSWTEDIETK